MKAVIMAGGFGTRIRPLTTTLPKPMLPFLNRPLLLHLIDLLKRHGIRELVVLLHYQPSQIQDVLGDGRRFGVQVEYCTTTTNLGTAGATKLARRHLSDTFILLSGDILTDFDLCAALTRHKTRKATASILLSRADNPCAFGVVDIDSRERVTRFIEKPSPGEVFSDKINTGIYILEPEVLDLLPPTVACDWACDVFPFMLRNTLPLSGLLCEGYWQDIGTPHAYLNACQDIYAGKVKLKHSTSIHPSHQHGTVLLAEGCQLDDSIHLNNVIIGRNCVIEPGCRLVNTILWDHVHLRRNSRVFGALLGNHVTTGPEVRIEQAIIADRSRINSRAHITRDALIRSPLTSPSSHSYHLEPTPTKRPMAT